MLCKVRCLGVLVIPLFLRVVYIYYMLCKEVFGCSSDSPLSEVVYVYCILCKVRCLGVLVIPLCLRVFYIYYILCKVRCSSDSPLSQGGLYLLYAL